MKRTGVSGMNASGRKKIGEDRDWESKYLDLRGDHESLKKQCNEQLRIIKQMHTRFQMIDETVSKRENNNNNNGGNNHNNKSKKIVDRETDAYIATLKSENERLRRANLDLREKLRAATGSGLPGSAKKPSRTNLRKSGTLKGELENFQTQGNQRKEMSVLKKQLLSADERIRSLHEQNNALRRRLETKEGNFGGSPTKRGLMNKHEQQREFVTIGGQNGEGSNREITSLQREIKDKDAQILIVKNRYDHLESKARAAAEIHERTVFMMEEGNRTIRDLRRRIQSLQHENEQLHGHQERAEELLEELNTTKEESRKLEERMTALCESPFINDAFESRSRVDKLVTLERSDRQQKLQIEHLKETAKTHHAEILALKSSSEQLVKQRDQLAKDNQELKLRLEQLQRGAGILEDKMKLYSGEAGVDSSELEKALTIVKRNQENMGQVGFIESSGATTANNAVAKQKLQELQVTHLNTCRELELTERMLKAQTSINKDLNAEITDLEAKLKGSNNELHRKLDDYETLCAKRLQKIHALEAQVKQLMKRKDKTSSSRGTGGNRNIDNDEDAVSIASLAASESDFGPGENLVEVWILSASLDDTKVEPGATTFAMLDFYDYETQTSPLLTGTRPGYDFAATYRIKVDHFFLRYLSSEMLTIELNRTKHADYELLGQCTIPLRRLLEDAGKIRIDEAQIISVRDGSVIGTFKICIRLALPVNELFKIYLQEVPGERERFERLKLAEKQENDTVLARAKAQNQLEVTIVGCSALGTSSGSRAPSPFAHFQLLSFPDSFTPIVQNSTDPVFDHRSPFPMLVDNKLLRYIERENLEINILDDSDELSDKDSDGILGKAIVPLGPLSKGEPISGEFKLRDGDGRQAGSVSIHMAWRSPLISLEDATSHTDLSSMQLSEEQIRQLIKQYDVDGSVDWKAFLSLSKPDSKVHKVQTRLRKILGRAADNGVNLKNAFSHFDKNGDGFIAPNELSVALKDLNFKVQNQDIQLLLEHLDRNKDGRISYDEFLVFAAPPSEVLRLVERSLRHSFEELLESGKDIERPFVRRQVEGLLSVRDFCKALRDLGFQLVDHERERADPRNEPDFSDEDDDDDDARQDRRRRIVNAAARKPDSNKVSDEQEEHDLEPDRDGDQYANMDNLFAQKKQEFQERITRASQASQNFVAADNNDFERQLIVRTYGESAEPSALMLQSRFRGYQSRKDIQNGKLAQSAANASVALVEAEDALRASLSRLDSKSNRFDLREIFTSRDTGRTGFLSVGLFMRGLLDARLGLSRANASALASHFTLSTERGKEANKVVDYNEFIKFARFQARDISGLSLLIRNATLQVKDASIFQQLDAENSGVLDRRSFVKALRKIPAMKALGSFDLKALVDVFDTESDGEIDYVSFVRFAQGQPLARALANVEDKLRSLIQRALSKGVDLESSFRHFDKNGDGGVSRQEFKQALRELHLDLSLKEMHALYARFDPSRQGVISYRSFCKFFSSSSSSSASHGIDKDNTRPSDLSVTQKRLQNIVRGALVAGLSIHGPFEHYDWTRSGTISRDMFNKACSLLGLPLTLRELSDLAEAFASDELNVKYREFIEWCSPKPVGARNTVERLRVLCSGSSRSNLMTTFQQFDKHGNGEISRKQLAQGLKELGMDMSREELVVLMSQFDRDGDGFIQYQEFVQAIKGSNSQRSPRGKRQSPTNQRETESAALNVNSKLAKCRSMLESYDKEFTGEVSRSDFESVMERLGLDSVNIDSYTSPKDDQVVLYKSFLRDQEGNQQFIDSVVRKLCEMIQRRAEAAGGDYKVPFDFFKTEQDDLDDENCCSYQGFKKGLAALEFALTDGEVHALVDKFDENGDGKIQLNEFIHTVTKANFGTNSPLGSPVNGMKREELEMSDHQIALLRRLVSVGRRRGVPIRSLFESVDPNHSGFVSHSDMNTILMKLDPHVPPSALAELIEALDSESEGKIEYGQVIHAGDHDYSTRPSKWSFQEKLRLMIREQESLQSSLRIPFTHFDRKRKGKFDQKSWKRAIADLALDVSDSDLLDTFREINLSDSGKISFNEFWIFVKDSEYVEHLERKLRKLILAMELIGNWGKDLKDIQKTFRAVVDSGDEKVDRHSLKSAMRKLGMDLSREDIVRMICRYDTGGDGRILYDGIAHFLEASSKMARQAVVISDRLRKLVRDKMRVDPSFSLREHFAITPPGGLMLKGQFLRHLVSAELNLSEKDAYRLADCFDFTTSPVSSQGLGTQLVDVEELLNFVLSASSSSSSSSSGNNRRGDGAYDDDDDDDDATKRKGNRFFDDRTDPEELQEITLELRKLIKRAKDRGTDYRKSFEHFDKDFSGLITLEQFQHGLAQLGFNLTQSQVRALFRKFAGGRKNSLNYRLFLRSLVPSDELYVEEVAEKLRRMFRERIEHHGGGKSGIKKTFRHFEHDSRGQVSRKGFQEGLLALKFDLTNSEVHALLDKFDLDGNGRISLEEFDKFVQGVDASAGKRNRERTLHRIDAEADEIANKLKSLVRKAHRQGVDYRQSFEHFDPHYAGNIDRSDFQKGLHKLGFDIKPEHVRVLMEKFSGRDGRIRYRDFLRHIAPAEEARAEEIADKFRRMLSRVGNLRKAFKHFRRNSAGNITRKAFKEDMQRLNFDLSDSEVRILMDIFDKDGDGEISFDEFIDFASTSVPKKQGNKSGKKNDGSESEDNDSDEDAGHSSTEQLSIHMHKMKLAKQSSSIERVYLQYCMPGRDEFVRTQSFPLTDPKKKNSLRLDYDKNFPLPARSQARKSLKGALRSNKCKIQIQVIGVKSSGRNKVLGQTLIDLYDILEEMSDLVGKDVNLYDDDDQLIAKINLTIKALDVLTLLTS